MQNTPDWGSCIVWDGESEYMRMSTKVVAKNKGQVLPAYHVRLGRGSIEAKNKR